MHNEEYQSWGRFPWANHRGCELPRSVAAAASVLEAVDAPVLPRGLGRSYGDVCLNENGYLLSTKWLDKFIAFDEESGRLRCEAGVTLGEILRLFVPRGWFLPAVPGTQYVTVGGAIANDIHGKNHHNAGSFGHHVRWLELLRSDGSLLRCSREENPDWFAATIGGLGLTGLITRAELALKPVAGPFIDAEFIKFDHLDGFFPISEASAQAFEYTVAWLDCLQAGDALGRGIFIRGNHSQRPGPGVGHPLHANGTWKRIPFDLPAVFLNHTVVKAFNQVYYHRWRGHTKRQTVPYGPFFFPLDAVHQWNRIYGKRGLLQWQCVLPKRARQAIYTIMEEIVRNRMASFLVVFKEFGERASEGMLSFPMPGYTLALDFANCGLPLFALLDRLDAIVIEHGGRLYPAKDARMARGTFLAGYPRLNEFTRYIDPKISSSFWRRIHEV